MMCFVIKKPNTLVGRRSSDLEQAHREQKGKKDTQNFTGKQVLHTASMLHIFRHFLHSSPMFHPFTISSQHWASQFLTQQIPHLFSLQNTPVICPRQGLCCLPASLLCLACHSASWGHHISLHPRQAGSKVPAQEGSCSPASPPSNLKITAISIWLISRHRKSSLSRHTSHLPNPGIIPSHLPLPRGSLRPTRAAAIQHPQLKGQTAQARHKHATLPA